MHHRRDEPAPERRNAFTMVEMLIVIAILAVLMAMGLHVAASSRVSVKNKAAAVQLKTLYNAIESFRVEYGHYPRQQDGSGSLDPDLHNGYITKHPDGILSKAFRHHYQLSSGDLDEHDRLIDPYGNPYRYIYRSELPDREDLVNGSDWPEGSAEWVTVAGSDNVKEVMDLDDIANWQPRWEDQNKSWNGSIKADDAAGDNHGKIIYVDDNHDDDDADYDGNGDLTAAERGPDKGRGLYVSTKMPPNDPYDGDFCWRWVQDQTVRHVRDAHSRIFIYSAGKDGLANIEAGMELFTQDSGSATEYAQGYGTNLPRWHPGYAADEDTAVQPFQLSWPLNPNVAKTDPNNVNADNIWVSINED
jgi:general secretion pathway protein G